MILSHSSVVSCYSMEHKLSDFVFGTHIAILCYLFYLFIVSLCYSSTHFIGNDVLWITYTCK